MSREQIDWERISWIKNLPDNFVLKYKDKLNFEGVLAMSQLKEETLEQCSSLFTPSNWHDVWDEQQVSEQFIEKYIEKVEWDRVCSQQTLSEKFIRKHIENIDWCFICVNQKLSESFIREFRDNIDFNTTFAFSDNITPDFCREMYDERRIGVLNVAFNNKVDKKIFDEYKKELNWYDAISTNNFTEEEIIHWRDYLNWADVIEYQNMSNEFLMKYLKTIHNRHKYECAFDYKKLDEKFIEKYVSAKCRIDKDDVWKTIWQSQTPSEQFIRKYINYTNKGGGWYFISNYKHVSDEFFIEFKDRITWNEITCSNMSDKVIEACEDEINWNEFAFEERSLEFIKKYWDKINKEELWSNWEYVKYKLRYKDELTNVDN